MADSVEPHSISLPDRLRLHAARSPERIACTFLRDDGSSQDIGYAALGARVDVLAAHLVASAAQGERVLLLYPSGIDFVVAFCACLAAGLVAVPAAPAHRVRDGARLAALLADADPALVLCAPDAEGATAQALARAASTALLLREQTGPAPPAPVPLRRNAVAFLQYTSGSTGQPKGVEVTHANIDANVHAIGSAFGFGSATVMVSWLPLFHDMGLIGSVCAPLLLGFRSVLMAPGAFLRRPAAWLEAITRFRATCSGAPNFAWDQCVRRVSVAQKAGLDLSSLEVLYNGAEPVRAATIARFVEAYAPCGLRRDAPFPCYGMAEATLLVAGGPRRRGARVLGVDAAALERGQVRPAAIGDAGAQALVSCGAPAAGMSVAVIDPVRGVRLPSDEVGELWIAGSGVARGYHGRPGDSARVFGARVQDAPAQPAGGAYLRSGDLGFVRDGEVFVTGRRKDVIIVHGRKLHAQDVEALVESSLAELAPNSCAAFALEGEGGERLALAVESTRALARSGDLPALEERVRAAVARGTGISLHTLVLVAPGGLPRTTSGKLRRSLCKTLFLEQALPLLAPRTCLTAASAARADAVIGWLRAYAPRRLDLRLADERRSLPPHVLLDFGNQGLFGLQAPVEAGGLALATVDLVRVMQQLAAIDLTLATLVGVHNGLGLRPLMGFAPAALRARWLPLLASGRQLAAFAMSEPQAGSNPRAIGTRALQVDGGWRVSGEKHLIGLAAWAGMLTVFARAFDASGRALGTLALVVPEDAPGLTQGPEALTMGMRAMVQNEIRFDAVFVPDAQVLSLPGAGMEVAQDAMGFARLGIGALCVGAMKRCAQLMARYARRREIAGGRLLDNPLTRRLLHELDCAIEAGEALVNALAAEIDGAQSQARALPLDACGACKCVLSELLWETADRLVQLLGGRGYLENNLAPQLLRDARALRILEGPSEALYAHLGALARLPGNPLAQSLATTFDAPALAAELSRVAQVAAGAEEHWLDGRSGEFAAWTLLAAAARGEAGAWARQRREALRRRIEAEAGQGAECPPAAALLARVASYAQTIGDGDAGAAGAAHALDPMLRRDVQAACAVPGSAGSSGIEMPRETLAAAPPCPPRAGAAACRSGEPPLEAAPRGEQAASDGLPGGTADASLDLVLGCVIRWFREGGAGDAAAPLVAPDTAFSDLGIDSLASVPLALELEGACGVPVSAELLYDYPTVRALADYIAYLRTAPREPADGGAPATAPLPVEGGAR